MGVRVIKIVEKASKELSSLTGLDLSTALGVENENSHWKVTLEMVEKHSIPDQMDILGIYEVMVDAEGNLISFKRKGLRKRLDTYDHEAE